MKFIKRFAIALSIVLMICACGDLNKQEKRTIVDSVGVEVEIPANIERVVCTNQSAMEFMVAMGLEDKMVGVHKSIFNHTWSPEMFEDMDHLKGFGYAPAAEALYEENVDLVIVKEASAAEDLRKAGIPTITFAYTNEEQLLYSVDMLGEIFGGEAKDFANKWTKYYKDTVNDIGSIVESIPEDERATVYYIDASTALDAGSLCSTVGKDSIKYTWIKSCGANLITEDYENIESINEELILSLNPETIVIGGWAENTRKEQLLSDPKWANVDAVKNNKIIMAPDGFISFDRYAVEAPYLLKFTTSQLYPQIYPFDEKKELKNYIKEFWDKELSDEKIEYMLEGLGPDGLRMD